MSELKNYIDGLCEGQPCKVLNVFFGDTLIEWPDGTRQWVGRDVRVEWPVDPNEESAKTPAADTAPASLYRANEREKMHPGNRRM